MTDYGATDTSTTTLGTNQFPANAVFVPGDTKLTVVQGGPKGTDGNGKTYAPVAEYVPDGNDLTQGITTDAAVTGDNAGTLSAKLRGLSMQEASQRTPERTSTPRHLRWKRGTWQPLIATFQRRARLLQRHRCPSCSPLHK